MIERGAVFYFGTRSLLRPDTEFMPQGTEVFCTKSLDAAIWAAELARGVGEPRVYVVEPTGDVEDVADLPGYLRPPYPSMTLRTTGPLRVLSEFVDWKFYHGTRAKLEPGDLIEPGYAANHGPTPRVANFVYFAKTLDAAVWGAELALGDGEETVYIVEPTGPYEDDPNLTNMKFRGNPTKSFRSRSPLRVEAILRDWVGHNPEMVRAMKEGLAKLALEGVEPEDS